MNMVGVESVNEFKEKVSL